MKIHEYPLPVTGYWAFALKTKARHNKAWNPSTVLDALIDSKFWLMFENIFRRRDIAPTHRVVVVMLSPGKPRFAACFEITGSFASLSGAKLARIKRQMKRIKNYDSPAKSGFAITDGWKYSPIEIDFKLACKLSFIKNPWNIGAHFQHAARPIPELDFVNIVHAIAKRTKGSSRFAKKLKRSTPELTTDQAKFLLEYEKRWGGTKRKLKSKPRRRPGRPRIK